MKNKKYLLNNFSFTMIIVNSIGNIRNLSITALFGNKIIIFFILGTIFFLIPMALITAELSSKINKKENNIYYQIKKALGKKIAFLIIWIQWVENIIWYPTILSFISGTVIYSIYPSKTNNPYLIWAIILITFWSVTIINLNGIYISSLFNNICTLLGLFIPILLIISVGFLWIILKNPVQISLRIKNININWFDQNMCSSLTSVIMSFCGIEIATAYVNNIYNPQYNFIRVLLYSISILLIIFILGSLSIAIILPKKNIDLIKGIMQIFDIFLKKYHLDHLFIIQIIGILLSIGCLGSVNNWIIVPTKGLLFAAKDKNLPKILTKINSNGAPTIILIIQGIIVSLISTLFLFIPNINSSYWILNTITTQLYMLMYLCMIITVIKLRMMNNSKTSTHFKIPGGITGLIITILLGSIGELITLIYSFIPPKSIYLSKKIYYKSILIFGITIICIIPMLIQFLKNKKLHKKNNLHTKHSTLYIHRLSKKK
ncbi:APC family permease [Candidatus Legionella polyplacis]|uniref:APC family permease n=1 Tax=Candidatus Legionella polyplacis TaxID=2005262 RepID=A0ABZ2GW29_9GAMM